MTKLMFQNRKSFGCRNQLLVLVQYLVKVHLKVRHQAPSMKNQKKRLEDKLKLLKPFR